MIRYLSVAIILIVLGFDVSFSDTLMTEKKISADFVDKDLREALKDVADKAQVSIVCTEDVQLKVSGKFSEVPWPVVLGSILSATDFGYQKDERDERVIVIRRKDQILETVVIHIEHAPVLDVRRTVEEFISGNGKVQDDTRSNSLIVTDQPEYISKIRSVVRQVDMAIPQVLIEALIIEVNYQDGKNVGINWQSLAGYSMGVTPGFSYDWMNTVMQNRSDVRKGDTSRAPSMMTVKDVQNPGSANATFNTFDTLSPDSPLSTSTNVNFAGTGDVRKSTFFPQNDGNLVFKDSKNTNLTKQSYYSAILDADTFKVVLSALEQTGHLDVLSNPHIVTTENREAEILVGERFPIADFVFNPETATLEVKGFEYIDIGISLRVTPRIVGGTAVLMDIQPEVSQEGAPIVFGGSSGTFIPRISTQEAKTKVAIQDGHTLVIGGLIREAEVNNKTGVPILGKIPLIGALFRSHGKEKVKRDLMIFITPRILTEQNMDAITNQKMNLVRPPKAVPAEKGADKKKSGRKH